MNSETIHDIAACDEFDPACGALADHFLADAECSDKAQRDDLAAAIQHAVELWFQR